MFVTYFHVAVLADKCSNALVGVLSHKIVCGNPQMGNAIWLDDNIDVPSSWMMTFSSSFGVIICLNNNTDVIIWLDNNILLDIGCYQLSG
jgi:hypothetical protein